MTGPGAPRFTPGDVRQFRREVRERRGDLEELRGDLRSLGVDAAELEDIVAALRALDDERVYRDLDEIERLQAAAIQRLKEFEYALRRQVEGADEERLFLSGSDEVPPDYRELVEEYYRALSGRP